MSKVSSLGNDETPAVTGGDGLRTGVPVVAGWGTGVHKGLPEAARRWISLGQTTRPRRKWAEHYARRRARYAALLEHLYRAWKVGEKP